jgi:nucleotide-binding universal stress UspA family protein
MFHTILVPLDGSRVAENALPLAAGIAERSLGQIRLARVHRPIADIDPTAPLDDDDLRRAERQYLESQAGQLRDTHCIAVSTTVIGGPVAQALCEEAQQAKADLMALTTHGRGPFSRFWLGSVTDELLRRTPVPLLIHRPKVDRPPEPGATFRFHRMLIPLDGSETADAVLAPAAELARLAGAEVTLLRIVEPVPVLAPDGVAYLPPSVEGPLLDEMTARAHADVDRAAARLRDSGLHVATQVTIHEQVAGAILEAAADADLIALATHSRGRVARFFLGSVADKVVRGAPCPVFVVRSPANSGGVS